MMSAYQRWMGAFEILHELPLPRQSVCGHGQPLECSSPMIHYSKLTAARRRFGMNFLAIFRCSALVALGSTAFQKISLICMPAGNPAVQITFSAPPATAMLPGKADR